MMRLTKDLVPVIMHDEKVDRTTDGNGYIYDLTYAELCKLDCSYPDKFAGKFGRLQIPTLREYLEWMAEEEDLITNIELKNSVYYYGGMEEKVIDMICEYGLRIGSSFPLSITHPLYCADRVTDHCRSFLVEKYVDNAGVYARTCDVQYYHPESGIPEGRTCTQTLFPEWDRGECLTVNEEEDMRRMKKWGYFVASHAGAL